LLLFFCAGIFSSGKVAMLTALDFISAAFSAALYKQFNFIYRFKIEEFSVLLYSLIRA
jgi:hypothetical protein